MSEAAVKKHVVRLRAEERPTLAALIGKGKHPAALKNLPSRNRCRTWHPNHSPSTRKG
jgi:hypothetical protein